MRLTVTTFVSLDGTMQAPGGPEEDPTGDFAHGGWTVPFFTEEAGEEIDTWFKAADAFLLGRRTYDIFAAYWPQVTAPDNTVAVALNTKPKYVPSTTLTSSDWEGTQILSGDVVAAIRELKAQDGRELQVHGSGDLLQTLLANDLVDEWRLITFPVLLGSGRRLFAEGTRPGALELVRTRALAGGVTVSVYRPAGPLRTGEFGIEDGQDVVIDDGSRSAA
jgi:dihydrofolate reductase